MAASGGGGHAPQPATAPLTPTFRGYINTTMDALILFEACLTGVLQHVPRRPHDRERSQLIVSGNVFIYEEHSSGIKRWTDGVPWSPSRILGNFLLYRELDKPFQPGEKKRAMKKAKDNGGVTKTTSTPRSNSFALPSAIGVNSNGFVSTQPSHDGSSSPNGNDIERQLVGSLVDSYQFKADGLVKKTISVTLSGMTHHLVSYYGLDDVKNGVLMTPGQSNYRHITPRPQLISSSNFRAPVNEEESFMVDDRGQVFAQNPMPQMNGYGMRSMSVPSMTYTAMPQQSYALPNSSYGMHPPPTQLLPPPPAVSYGHPATSSYQLDSSSPIHGRPLSMHAQGFPPMQTSPQQIRRSNSIADTNTTNGLGYSSISSMGRGPSGHSYLPSNGSIHAHGMSHSSLGSLYDSQGSGGSHGPVSFDSNPPGRGTSTYNHGPQHHGSNFGDGLPPNGFDATGTGPDYGSGLNSGTNGAEFHSASDDETSDNMHLDLHQSVSAADVPNTHPTWTNPSPFQAQN